MKSNFTNDLGKVLDLMEKMGNELKSDCEESMKFSFRAMFDVDNILEKAYDMHERTADIDARIFLQNQITDAVKKTMDRYNVGVWKLNGSKIIDGV